MIFNMAGDWFETLLGFAEGSYATTREKLAIDDDELVSSVNGARYGVGRLTLPTLAQLRSLPLPGGTRTSLSSVVGDARALHSEPEFDGATFQVASQFNVLEMPGPSITPEDGVTDYQHDHTQGPACALAAAAATIYRNYFAPVDGQAGQTHHRQLNTLAGLGAELSRLTNLPVAQLWTMRNGYALATSNGLAAIAAALRSCTDVELDSLRGHLAIGLHSDVQVTDVLEGPRRHVTQVFCSALPVAYGGQGDWEPFARLVLDATYEATLRCAAASSTSKTVLLTRVGGGVFGNHDRWIDDAIERALEILEFAGLDVRFVSRGSVHPSFDGMVRYW